MAAWKPIPGTPANVVSKRGYRGLNLLLLDMAATRHNVSSRWWGTFNQWKNLGGRVMPRPSHVPPGKWGTQIVFWAPVVKTVENENGEEEEDRFFFMRTYASSIASKLMGLTTSKPVNLTPVRTTSSITSPPKRHWKPVSLGCD